MASKSVREPRGARSDRARSSLGEKLKRWRESRGRSQLRLALDVGISARHLCFLETGRARPSREMVLRLAVALGLPLREQNALLLDAGFAPAFEQRSMEAPALAAVRAAAESILARHEPFAAVALDRNRDIVLANRGAEALNAGIAPELLGPKTNIYRLLLHPGGLAPRIVGFATYAKHLLNRLLREADATGNEALRTLLAELETYPGVGPVEPVASDGADPLLTLRLHDRSGILSFFTMVSTFGTPFDVTTSELVLECLFPADEQTARCVREAASRARADDGYLTGK